MKKESYNTFTVSTADLCSFYDITADDLTKLHDMQKDKRSGLRWRETNGITYYNEEQMNRMFKRTSNSDRIKQKMANDAGIREAIKKFRGIK